LFSHSSKTAQGAFWWVASKKCLDFHRQTTADTASAKHTHQKPHMLGEIAEDGYYSRYLEIRSVVHALKYAEDKPADEFGALTEGLWDALEAATPKCGTRNEI
jgi:hypothetical protein